METVKYSKRWEEVGFKNTAFTVLCTLVLEMSYDGKITSKPIAIICERMSKAKNVIKIKQGQPRERLFEDVPCYYGAMRIADRWVMLGSIGHVPCYKITLDEMKNRVENQVPLYYAAEYRNAKEKFNKIEQEWKEISSAFNYELKDDANGTMG